MDTDVESGVDSEEAPQAHDDEEGHLVAEEEAEGDIEQEDECATGADTKPYQKAASGTYVAWQNGYFFISDTKQECRIRE